MVGRGKYIDFYSELTYYQNFLHAQHPYKSICLE